MSLSVEAEKRKERLLALKKRKRGPTEDIESPSETALSSTNDSTAPGVDVTKSYTHPFPSKVC